MGDDPSDSYPGGEAEADAHGLRGALVQRGRRSDVIMHLSMYAYLSLSLSLYIYIYTFIIVCMCVYIYIYIYIYIHTY